MNWKTAGIVFGVIVFLVITGTVGFKIIQRTESQRAREIVNHNYEMRPLFGGCASLRIEATKK